MFKKSLPLLILIFTIQFSSAQEKLWKLNLNIGPSFIEEPADGFFIATEVGIPLSGVISIKPNFTYASTVRTSGVYAEWNEKREEPLFAEQTDLKGTENGGLNFTSTNIMIEFNILGSNYKDKQKKNNLAIAVGVGYKSNVESTINYYTINSSDPYYISTESDSGFGMNIILSYNYLFKNNIYTGVNASIDGLMGSGGALFGATIGIKFDPKA
ncbi:MAG: hypothetical protein ACPGRE_00785 [Flavobacteriaceae bacterium]